MLFMRFHPKCNAQTLEDQSRNATGQSIHQQLFPVPGIPSQIIEVNCTPARANFTVTKFSTHKHRKPETFVLLPSSVHWPFLVPLQLICFLTRERELERAISALQRFSRMILNTQHVLMKQSTGFSMRCPPISQTITVTGKLTPQQGWEYVAHHHSKSLPITRFGTFDSDGNQRFILIISPLKFNAEQRNYFETLKNGAESTSDGFYWR